MTFFDLDTQALQFDIRQLVAECIRCKRLLGAAWTRPMAEEQRLLVRTRRKVTDLFVLLAHSRGRQHLRDADANLVIALRTAPGYTAVAMGAAQ